MAIVFAIVVTAPILVEYPLEVNEQLVSELPAAIVWNNKLEGVFTRRTSKKVVQVNEARSSADLNAFGFPLRPCSRREYISVNFEEECREGTE